MRVWIPSVSSQGQGGGPFFACVSAYLLSGHGRTKGGNTGLRVSASFAEFSAANVPASSSSMSAAPSRRTPKGARMGDGRKEGQGRRSRYAARHALRPKRKRDSSPSCGWVRNDGRGRRAGFGMTVVGGGLRSVPVRNTGTHKSQMTVAGADR
jgi:hypothetical protein